MELKLKICTKGANIDVANSVERVQPDNKGKPTWRSLAKGYPAEILGVPFGGHIEGRDTDGEAFHDETDIVLNKGDEVPLTYFHGYGPDDIIEIQNPPEIIGIAKYAEKTTEGHLFNARIDPKAPLGARVIDVLEAGGEVKASSGSISYLIRMGGIERKGLIDFWPVAELAIFDTNDWRRPANELAVVNKRAITEPKDLEEVAGKAIEEVKGTDVTNSTKSMSMEDKKQMGDEVNPATLSEEQVDQIVNLFKDALAKNTKAVEDAIEETVANAVEEKLKASGLLDENEPGAEVDGAPAYLKGGRGTPSDSDAYWHFVRTGKVLKGSKAALQEGADSEGGYLVPPDEYRRIISKRDETSILRVMGATQFTTNRDVLHVPVEDTSLTKFVIVAEEGAISGAEEEPTFGQVVIPVYKFGKLIKVSEELLADDNAGLEAFLEEAIGRAAADTENYYLINGSGSSQPAGLLQGATLGKTFAANSDITPAEAMNLKYALAQPYRDASVCWLMSPSTEGVLHAKTGDPFVFQPMPAGGNTRRLENMLGYPVFGNSNMPDIGSSTKSLFFGNMRYMAVVTNQAMRIRRLTEVYAVNGQVGIWATFRMGMAPLQAEALQYGQHPA
jgi:HK97 family phage major capsid protein